MNKAAGLTAVKQEELKAAAGNGPAKGGAKKVSRASFPRAPGQAPATRAPPPDPYCPLLQVDKETEAAERKKKMKELRAQRSTDSDTAVDAA